MKSHSGKATSPSEFMFLSIWFELNFEANAVGAAASQQLFYLFPFPLWSHCAIWFVISCSAVSDLHSFSLNSSQLCFQGRHSPVLTRS